MAISVQKARVLATKTEFALFRASLPKSLGTLTEAVIKRNVVRARSLRDKYRQLAKKQARSKKEGERTLQKAQMFDEALDRFQAGLKEARKTTPSAKAARSKASPPGKKKVGAKKKTTAGKKKATPKKKAVVKKSAESAWFDKPKPKQKKGTGPKKKAARKKGVGPTSRERDDAAKRSQIDRGGRTRKRTHTSARGKRNQAKRDRSR